MGSGVAGDKGALTLGAVLAAQVARHPLYVGERGPDSGIEFVEPEIGGDEAETAVEADGGTDEDAVDVDDIGLQPWRCSFGQPGALGNPAPSFAANILF